MKVKLDWWHSKKWTESRKLAIVRLSLCFFISPIQLFIWKWVSGTCMLEHFKLLKRSSCSIFDFVHVMVNTRVPQYTTVVMWFNIYLLIKGHWSASFSGMDTTILYHYSPSSFISEIVFISFLSFFFSFFLFKKN